MLIRIIAIVAGIGLIVNGVREMSLAGVAKSEPQTLSVIELVDQGYGDNAHVTVTDMFFSGDFVYEGYERSPDEYTKVWMPVLTPREGDGLSVHLVVRSSELESESQVHAFTENQSAVTGVIVNEIEKIGTEELNLLRESFPNIRSDDVFLLDHNRKPATWSHWAFIGGGIALVLVGIGLVLAKITGGSAKPA